MPTEADLLKHVPECVGWIAGTEPISEVVIDAGQQLRVISRNGSGIDNLPLSLINQREIQVFTALGTNARGVAELAIALILSGLRNIIPAHEGIRRGEWPRVKGREICDCTIGVVGPSAIGTDVTQLAIGLGAKVVGFDPYAAKDHLAGSEFERMNLDSVLLKRPR